MIGDIHPKSPVHRLRRDYDPTDRAREFDVDIVAAIVGMSRAFIARALGKPGTRPKFLSLDDVLLLLDVDGFQETFLPRSHIPEYLLSLQPVSDAGQEKQSAGAHPASGADIILGNSRDLILGLAPGSVQCAVTSSPYWGMRVYDNERDVQWADSEKCPYGFEQTPEGFIRHTIELLFLLRPAIAAKGSVWWNLMDTYNTRTPIRGNARERLDAMSDTPGSRKGWTEHGACRHSAGHMYLDDAELSSIPPRVAERASRIGYKLKSFVTWRKHASTPEAAKNRVSRQGEHILHLSVGRTPFFDRGAWQNLHPQLGGPDPQYESAEKITDVWYLSTSTGQNGHGAEFPLALAGRCIALTSNEGDLIVDPFVGSGTTALAAVALGRRCVGFDISEKYVELARQRVAAAVASRAEADRVKPEAVSTAPQNGSAPRVDRSDERRASHDDAPSNPTPPLPHCLFSFGAEVEITSDLAATVT